MRGSASSKPGRSSTCVWDTRPCRVRGPDVRPLRGTRSYVYHRHAESQSRKFTFGPVALGSVDEARRTCMRGLEQDAIGGAGGRRFDDPRAPLFRDFVAGPWKAACYEPCKPSTKTSKDWALNNQLLPAFADLPLDKIDRTGVIRWFEGYSATAPGGANSALLVFRQIMNHAVARGHIETNPTRGLKRNPRPKLTRFLSREEIGRLHEVLDGYELRRPSCKSQADIIRLLLQTGCRTGEILKLRWREVGGDTLELEDSKTGPRQVLLSPEARSVIERQPRTGNQWVFPSADESGARRALISACGKRCGSWPVSRMCAFTTSGTRLPARRRCKEFRCRWWRVCSAIAQVQMTLRYAHVSDRDVEASAERIGGVMAGIMDKSPARSEGAP